jgi:hypothetical protein
LEAGAGAASPAPAARPRQTTPCSARQFDQAGNENACMDEIGTAKAQIGVQ